MFNKNQAQAGSSFRDPSGYIFRNGDGLYRLVNSCYKNEYKKLIASGLYQTLIDKGLLVVHQEISETCMFEDSFMIIKPNQIPFISYPYEWCFGQLKDAALLTLDIQIEALKKNMSLKDASAYNVQFKEGKPIFIDTLSFETYKEGQPWVAYKQFCQHFLAPLALMSLSDIRLNKLFINFIDGIPLDLASALLPLKSKLSPSLGLHIHLHSMQQIRKSNQKLDKDKIKNSMSRHNFFALIDSLKSAINKLNWKPDKTEWHDYYLHNNNYKGNSLYEKEIVVSDFLASLKPNSVWDLGANDGRFSRIACQHAKHVVSWDIDPACVENNYRSIKIHRETALLPLLIDLSNPSPAIGWSNAERDSFLDRGPCDVLLSLGLIHHLAISNNIPLAYIARFFSRLGKYLLIEFVPKEDSQVMKLLVNRPDNFPNYHKDGFEEAFYEYFTIERTQVIKGTVRTLYFLKVK